MERFLLATLLVLCAIGMSDAVEAFGYAKNKILYPGKCYIRPNWVMEPGESMQHPNECARVNCFADASSSIQTCTFFDQLFDVPFTCRDEGHANYNGPFPDCCEHSFVCDETELV